MRLIYNEISNGIAELYIYGDIGSEVNGKDVSNEINYINKNSLAKQIHIHVNTDGGYVGNGFYIVGAILNSKIPVHVYNDFRAYSMGGIFMLAAKKENRYMINFGSTMFHAPHFGKSSKLSKEEKEYLENVKQQFVTYISETSNLSQKDIDEIMKKNVFLNADQMVKKGLINKDNIFTVEDTPQYLNKMIALYNVNEKTKSKGDNNNKNNLKMEITKKINSLLGLNKEASDDATIEKVTELNEGAGKLQKQVKEATAKLKETQGQLKAKDDEIKDLQKRLENYKKLEKEKEVKERAEFVDSQIKEGKFSKDDRDSLIEAANNNFDSFKLVCEKLTIKDVKAPDVIGQIDLSKNNFGIKPEEFNFETLEEKYPKILDEIKNKNPKLYEKLAEVYDSKYANQFI